MFRHGWLTMTLILAGQATPALSQVKLQWKLKEGESFFVEEKTHTLQKNKIRGSLHVQELDQTKVSRFKVLKVASDGSLVLQQQIESIKAVPQGTGAEASVSALKLLEGVKLRIAMDARQRVTEVRGYRDLVETLTKKDPDNARVLRAVLTEDSLHRAAAVLLDVVPDKAVARGQSWKIKSLVPFGPLGILHYVDTFTFQGADEDDKDVVRVDITSAATYSTPPAVGGLPLKVISGDVKVKESKGHLLFNVKTGRLLRRETELKLHLPLTVAVADQQLEMDVQQEQTYTARVLDHNPLKK
jgi:hypothetical protein